jgi:hypothetical protein
MCINGRYVRMRRRKFVSAVCVAGTATLAGCGGVLGGNDEEVAALEERLEDRESKIEELETEVASERGKVEDRDARIGDLETELESSRETRRSTYVDYYDIADDLYWDGADRFGEAEGHRQEENWSYAARVYFRAAPRFEDAAILWSKLAEHLASDGYEDGKGLADGAAAAAHPAFETCELLGEGCWSMAQGKQDEAEATFEEAQDPREAAIEREPDPLEAFESALS